MAVLQRWPRCLLGKRGAGQLAVWEMELPSF